MEENPEERHRTFVIECCESDSRLLRKALKWEKIHGPNTKVYVDPILRKVHLCWEEFKPDLLPVEKFLAGKRLTL